MDTSIGGTHQKSFYSDSDLVCLCLITQLEIQQTLHPLAHCSRVHYLTMGLGFHTGVFAGVFMYLSGMEFNH